jgi:citrate synthase
MTATAPTYSPGLEGVIAGETAISTVEGGLRYRGYPVAELCEHADFDQTAHLLLHGELPTENQLRQFRGRVAASIRLPEPLKGLLPALPKWASPLDVLRSAVSILSHFDPDTGDSSPEANLRKAERLLAQLPLVVADYDRYRRGLTPVPAHPERTPTAHFLEMVRGCAPTPDEAKAFDVSLILYAEHEFNASTFAARVVTSTESDLHSAIVAAIGALKGRLHGGANEKVMDVLQAAGGPDTAEAYVLDLLSRKERLMGFGHRVYKTGDVRAGILADYTRKLATTPELQHWEATAEVIERVMAREKNMYPNLDWPAGRLYHALGLEIPIYTPIFAMSRLTGWAAHVMEQSAANRLIRPRGLYTGPEQRAVRPLAERG